MVIDADWNLLPPSEKARTLSEFAQKAIREGNYQLAYGYYTQSLKLYRGLEDHPNTLRCLIRISSLAGRADFRDGLGILTRHRLLEEEAISLAREIGDNKLLAEALCAFATAGISEQATAMLEEAIALAEASGDKGTQARALARLALTLAKGKDEDRSRRLNEQALQLYEEIGDKRGIASTLFSISSDLRGAVKRAMLERALELQRELGAKMRMAEILMVLEWDCDRQDLDRREALNLEVVALCREFGSPIWEADALMNLAEVARARGDEAQAEELERESRSLEAFI